jgi:NTE family protein
MAALGVSSKYNADWNFLCSLRDRGRTEAGAWLEENYHHIGQRSSVDISREFL